MRTVVWFRGKDLRLADHAPLVEALRDGTALPVFVLEPSEFSPERAAERPHHTQFLLDSLRELEIGIRNRGGRLLVVSGESSEIVPRLAHTWKVDRVVAHRRTEPDGRAIDAKIAEALKMPLDLFEGETLTPPGVLRTGSGSPYARFTPFSRAFWREANIGAPLVAPARLPAIPSDVRVPTAHVPTCRELGLTRNQHIQKGGESMGARRIETFLNSAAEGYDVMRDRMDRSGTSRLSADLKFGTASVRTIWNAVARTLADSPSREAYLRELIWREFSYSTLWDRPEVLTTPFRRDFVDFPWGFDEELWEAWATGHTGYPIVDAASRQLLSEGFVHNRARMIHASFLTKHLLIHYEYGEAHYMKYLTDGDAAQNNAGWQWSAGCGCDAQPYFRVFNPMTQGAKFDPTGEYVRRWIPELREVPHKFCHAPWMAPVDVAAAAGVTLGVDYPHPVVDHQTARQRFLRVASEHLSARRA